MQCIGITCFSLAELGIRLALALGLALALPLAIRTDWASNG